MSCKGTGRFLCANGLTMRCSRLSANPCPLCGWEGVTAQQTAEEDARLAEQGKAAKEP